jgi:hypothetical protein
MRERCEVCANFRPDVEFDGDRKTTLIPFGDRSVRLCRAHERIAANSGVTSFDGLRELYGSGRRSFVPRRGASRSEMYPQHAGRRATDRPQLDAE